VLPTAHGLCKKKYYFCWLEISKDDAAASDAKYKNCEPFEVSGEL
jgi:hypothetical protein